MAQSVQQLSGRDAPFQLRGSAFTMMVLKLVDPDDPAFFALLADKVRQAPGFFRNAPVVLDFEELADIVRLPDIAAFLAQLRETELIPIGVVGGARALQEQAIAAGLAVLPPGRVVRAATEDAPEGKSRAKPTSMRAEAVQPEPQRVTTLVVNEPVRSGQQIYAQGGDLIVTAPVGAGAELVADGHIHIYAPLRGRALAGVNGDTSARIFCQSLEAELVSIAGLYRVSEDIERRSWKQPVQIFLDQGYLRMEPLA